MSNSLTKTNQEINLIEFTKETVELIKKTVAADLTDQEFAMFLYQAKRTGLDPMARQIYAIKRAGKTNIQSSIDGLRLVAQRSGEYAGQDEPVFEDTNGFPKVAKVSVYKFAANGQRYPAAVGVAYWSEYCPASGQDFMWKKMPHTMLAKVAEALALRKAFPQELSGLYTTEEMEQSNTQTVQTYTPPTPQTETLSPQDKETEEQMDKWPGTKKKDDVVEGEVVTKPAKQDSIDPKEVDDALIEENFEVKKESKGQNDCADCDKKDLPENYIKYSIDHYGRELCYGCQMAERKRLKEKATASA